MLDALETHYLLRRIRPERRDAAYLVKALAIYHANTPHLELTSTNEIQYWAEKYNTSFDDQLFLFSFECNEDIIGFAQCVYFSSAEIVVLDYMSMEESYKTVGSFFIFYEQIKSFLTQEGIQYNYMVSELLKDSEENFTESSDVWRTMMALENFRVIDAPYEQLQLGKNKFDTQLPGRLMIAVESGTESIRRETYLMIVNTLFFDHFVRWYEPFLTEEENIGYRTSATKKFNIIRSAINSQERISLSAIAPMSLPTGSIKTNKAPTVRFIAVESISYVILLVVLLAAQYFLKTSAVELIILAIGALIVRMTILSIFVPEAKSALGSSILVLGALLGKKNTVTRKPPKRPSDKRGPI